jgi:hypothetical protein
MVLEDKFIDLVIKELKNLWPKCQMVGGSPQHSESNGGVKRVNQMVQKKLGGWMKTNNSQHWLIGCKIDQWRINTQVHQTIKDTPYHLTYGQHSRVGISNLPVSADILANLRTEAQLQDVYLLMNSSINVASNCVELANNGFDAGIVAVTIATADTLVDTLVSLSHLGKRKGRSPHDASQLSRKIRDAKRMAMSTAVVQKQNEEVLPIDLTSPSGGKSAGDYTQPYIRWLELIDEHDNLVELEEMLHARVSSVFPIIYCTNNKDIFDDSNWAPCILRKVRKEGYEVLDWHEMDKVDKDLDWGGADDLLALWSMYYKYSTMKFVNLFHIELQGTMNDIETHDVSPKHHPLCTNATMNVQKKANSITAKVLKKSPSNVFKLGDAVLIPLEDVDCTKVGSANLAGVVVLINKDKSTCWVAMKQGLLHLANMYHVLKPVPEASNNLNAMDLHDAYDNWRSLPKVTEREAAHFILSVGGQGVIHCNCRGSCTTNSCSCKKVSRLCSSRCHRNSQCCKNTHDV